MLSMDLRPIGKINRLDDSQCLLEIKPSFEAGISGLHVGDKIQVLYWMHELSFQHRRTLTTHPQGNTNLPQKGVFALRSCVRPNPIGVTVVEIVSVEKNQIRVLDLDALDNAPIIDIKIFSY